MVREYEGGGGGKKKRRIGKNKFAHNDYAQPFGQTLYKKKSEKNGQKINEEKVRGGRRCIYQRILGE